ncbi:hypothetical protein PGTUg99_011916 [Puccinia graminis f. sp. tritici]|uniref:Uncharacterized protein n=1 Tax=Puccinia graminis f. sp. tritici TaxID=56615 RepID=A0A5B0RJE8_PUCGR|nr:hypothetical protein PGTUg99_011916 [Puccinia graminis f. sp. tritici]
MQLSSIFCAFHLLHFYVISAHPTLYPKALEKRDIEDVAKGTQHTLHKRMNRSDKGKQQIEYGKATNINQSNNSRYKSEGSKAADDRFDAMLFQGYHRLAEQVDLPLEARAKAAERHLKK